MFYKTKLFFFAFVLLMILPFFVAPPASSQDFRERMRQKIMERMKEKNGMHGSPSSSVDAPEVFLDVGGVKRSYLVYVPKNLPSGYAGAILVFHGGGGNAHRMLNMSNMHAVADREGFISVYVQTSDKGVRWMDGRDESYQGKEDIDYVRAVINSLQKKYNVDPNRVFATGISNGGAFINRLACDAPGLVKGIAPIAANMSIHLNSVCDPSKGTPVIMFSGTDDPLMPFNGGKGDPPPFIKRAMNKQGLRPEGSEGMLSSHDTIKFWAGKNACSQSKNENRPDRVDDGTTISVATYDGCRDGKAVLFQINGGGHAWPGRESADVKAMGATSREIEAGEEMARFFKAYGL
jgi:polyhydroxybutyrate depolymerase